MMNDNKFKKVWRCFLTLSALISSLTIQAQQDSRKEVWVDSIFSTLDLNSKIGQLMMIPAYAGGNTEHYKAINQLIEDHSIGGVMFMQGGPVAQAKLTNMLQNNADIPLLIAMDAEWGVGIHLDSTLSFPIAMSLGALRNDSLIYKAALEIGSQLHRLGVHMNFAPVADINTNPENPVIGMRAFSDDPQQVYEKASMFSAGLMDAGIIPVVKHFPGHGDTEIDSHLGLPVLKTSREQMIQRELYPFRKFAEANIPAIMAGHLYAPNIINDGLPVSLSPMFLKNIIRRDWGYNGLIVSDALNMGAITDNFKKGQAEEFALIAGNDILLFPDHIPAALRRIKRALRRGKISEEQLDQSVKRVLSAKFDAGLAVTHTVDTSNVIISLNSPEAQLLQRELALNSITLLNNKNNFLPIKHIDDKNFAVIKFGDKNASPLNDYLNKYARFTSYDYENSAPDIFEKLGLYDVVVAGIFSSGLQEQDLRQLEILNSETNLIIVAFGSPYIMEHLNNFNNVVWVPDQTGLSQKLLPQLIFGAESFNGEFPVDVGEFSRGTGFSTSTIGRLAFSIPEGVDIDGNYLKRIDEIMEETIKDKATPGGQVLIARHGKVVWEKSYGYHTYDSILPVDDFTLFDLASITKVTSSVPSIMFLYEHGLIDLDKKISVYLPDLKGSNKENMTLRDILTHQAGLWPYLPFYKSTMEGEKHLPNYYSAYSESGINQISFGLYASSSAEDSVWQWVKQSKVREKTAHEPYDYRYSDMGYYIIQKIIEKLVNQPMEEFLNQNFYDPIGMVSMDYQPTCHYPLNKIAPTEVDDYFRFQLVHGFVHDQGAALVGGVAGHAGLFSNALDLGKYMQLMLQKGSYGGRQYLQPETVDLFTQQQYETNRRGIGWDKPVTDSYGGPTGEKASAATFGHTGFTGTAAWVDPEFDLVYVFISNRVYPDALNTKLITDDVRTRIQDVIYKAMFRALQYEDIQ